MSLVNKTFAWKNILTAVVIQELKSQLSSIRFDTNTNATFLLSILHRWYYFLALQIESTNTDSTLSNNVLESLIWNEETCTVRFLDIIKLLQKGVGLCMQGFKTPTIVFSTISFQAWKHYNYGVVIASIGNYVFRCTPESTWSTTIPQPLPISKYLYECYQMASKSFEMISVLEREDEDTIELLIPCRPMINYLIMTGQEGHESSYMVIIETVIQQLQSLDYMLSHHNISQEKHI